MSRFVPAKAILSYRTRVVRRYLKLNGNKTILDGIYLIKMFASTEACKTEFSHISIFEPYSLIIRLVRVLFIQDITTTSVNCMHICVNLTSNVLLEINNTLFCLIKNIGDKISMCTAFKCFLQCSSR